MSDLKAIIYDLDGVITETARFHYESWKAISLELGLELTEKLNTKLKGIGRRESLDKIIEWSGVYLAELEKQQLLQKKNQHYLKLIEEMNQNDVFDGFIKFNQNAMKKGFTTAVGSSSKNAIKILDYLDIIDQFHVIIDGGMVKRTKPAPDIFKLAAERLNIIPENCIVVEDSLAGIEAAKLAGMKVISFGEKKFSKMVDSHLYHWSKADIRTFNKIIS
jgi:beta-phosphoglucomutase